MSMITKQLTGKDYDFIVDLRIVSSDIAAWAYKQLDSGCSLEEVKLKLKQVMEVCERN